MQFILAILSKDKLDQIFDTYFNSQKRDTAMGALIRRLVDTPDHASYVPRLEKFHDVDLPLVRLYARQVLTFHKWKSDRNVIRSHIDWIQMMMDRSLRPGALSADDFKRYLGMTFDPQRASQEGEHTYEFTIQLTGASLLIAGYVGTVKVEKTSGRKWEKTFDVEFWGGNVSATLFDAKIGSEFKGAGRSYLEWTENDIPGRVRLARASASVGMDLAGSQAGFMHVLGDESLPSLDVFFWEAKLGVPNVMKILEDAAKGKVEKEMTGEGGLTPKGVVGLDAGVSVLWGTISESGSILDRLKLKSRGPADLDLSRDLQTDVSVVRSLDTQVHFCLDDDQPTAAAIQALRIVCATELPLFMTPDTYLVIVGHADTLGSKEYNKDLSRRRADNTLQAIRNILGERKFKIKDDGTHIRIVPKGEELAAKESPTKETPAPKHRRVQIFLNSVLVLTLFGQTTIGGPETKPHLSDDIDGEEVDHFAERGLEFVSQTPAEHLGDDPAEFNSRSISVPARAFRSWSMPGLGPASFRVAPSSRTWTIAACRCRSIRGRSTFPTAAVRPNPTETTSTCAPGRAGTGSHPVPIATLR